MGREPACCIVSSVVHLGSNPALLGVVFRPPGDDSHNYHNLAETGHFTLSHVTAAIHEAAHQTSARYAKDVSEFEAVGLTPHWHEGGRAIPGPRCGRIPGSNRFDRSGRPAVAEPLSIRHGGHPMGGFVDECRP